LACGQRARGLGLLPDHAKRLHSDHVASQLSESGAVGASVAFLDRFEVEDLDLAVARFQAMENRER
jgi:hypothetical protein